MKPVALASNALASLLKTRAILRRRRVTAPCWVGSASAATRTLGKSPGLALAVRVRVRGARAPTNPDRVD